MASISKINGKWRALVRLSGHAPVSKYFPTKAEASAWAAEIESQIREGKPRETPLTVGQLIQRYRKLRDQSRPILDTSNEHYMLNALDRILGERKAASLSSYQIVAWAQKRKDEGAGPYTLNMELSKLGTVYKYAGMGLDLPDAVGKARPLLAHLGLIGGGGKRERRPTQDELRRLIEAAPGILSQIIRFAVATAMRRGEIVTLRWDDLDDKRKMIWVRNRKDPRQKEGNDQEIPLLGDAWTVIQERKKTKGDSELIFPHHPQSLSKYFKALCDKLGIPDLHFHDLRHEGTSQLFEQGFEIQHVALVTGHKSWQHLRRYANLKPESLHSLSVGLNKRQRRVSQQTSVSRQRKSESEKS